MSRAILLQQLIRNLPLSLVLLLPQKEAVETTAKHLHDVRDYLKNKGQTLTEIYNDLEDLRAQTKTNTAHPAYALLLAHEALDKAVYAAYGWDYPLADEEILERLLALNLARAAQEAAVKAAAKKKDAEAV